MSPESPSLWRSYLRHRKYRLRFGSASIPFRDWEAKL